MKKMILVALLLLVAPAMAAVTLSCDVDEDATPPTLSIAYDASGEPNLVRAFALDIVITGGTTIEAVGDVNPDYDIYPGTIIIDPNTGDVNDAGSPVAPAGDPGAQGALGGSAITIEMGSLYEAGVDVAPNDVDGLIVLELGNLAAGTVNVTTNETRARIVLEDSTVIDSSTSCDIEVGCACLGDLNGDNYIRVTDLTALATKLTTAGYPYRIASTSPLFDDCADMNGDNYIRVTDLTALATMLTNAGYPYRIACP